MIKKRLEDTMLLELFNKCDNAEQIIEEMLGEKHFNKIKNILEQVSKDDNSFYQRGIYFTANILKKKFKNEDETLKFYNSLMQEINEQSDNKGAILSFICGMTTGFHLAESPI